MDTRKIILLVGALIVAAVTAFFARTLITGSSAPQASGSGPAKCARCATTAPTEGPGGGGAPVPAVVAANEGMRLGGRGNGWRLRLPACR